MDKNLTDEPHSTLTLIARRSPYGESGARETLDIAFAAAVFDRQVRYLFIGDGVWQLKKDSDSSSALEALGKKPMGSALETLELYGIDRVYALRASIDERGLSPAELIDCVEIIDEPAVRELLAGPGPIVNL